MDNKELEAYKFFIRKGWTPAQSAGIVSNLKAESGFKTTAKGDGGHVVKVGNRTTSGSHGIAQWNGPRLMKLQDRYGDKWTDFNNQLEYVHWELTNTEKAAGDALRNTKTSAQAADVVTRKYERPKYADKDSKHRQGLANEITKNYIGQSVGSEVKIGSTPKVEFVNNRGFSKEGMKQYSIEDGYSDEDEEDDIEDSIFQLLEEEEEEDFYTSKDEEETESEEELEQGVEKDSVADDEEYETEEDYEIDINDLIERSLAEKEEKRNLALGIFSDFDDEYKQQEGYQFKRGGMTDIEYLRRAHPERVKLFNSIGAIREDIEMSNLMDQLR